MLPPPSAGGRGAAEGGDYSAAVLSEDLVEPAEAAPSASRRRSLRLPRFDRRLPEADTWVRRPSGPVRWLFIDLVVVSIIVTIALVVVLRLWDVAFRVPFGYGGDGLQHARDAKTIVQTGWVQTTPRLGAPTGQELWDFPISADNGNYLIMRLMAFVTHDWGLIVNGFFLLSFYTASWASYLCLRWINCGRTSSVVCAALFAFAPYHFARGSGHLLLSSYFIVPVALLLAVRAASGRPLLARNGADGAPAPPMRRTGSWLAFHARSSLPWILLGLACASFGSYYAIFTLITILLATLVVAATRRSIQPLLTAVSYCAVVAGMLLFNLLPNLLYRASHGTDFVVAQRLPAELDIYGLRLIQMVTPVPGEWFGPLRSISEDLLKGYTSEPSQFFGLVAAVALLVMLGWVAMAIVRRERRQAFEPPQEQLRSLLAFLTLVWILIATTGGLDWLVAVVGFTQLRAWNRISILLMIATLAWLALSLGPVAARWAGSSPARRRWLTALAGLVLLVGLVDQGSTSLVTDPTSYEGTFASDKAFFTSIEAQLPKGAMVYELPYRQYPEEPPTFGSGDYDLLRPFLQTESLRWSYGGMKGRESDWQAELLNLPAHDLTKDVIAVGYQGYVIDRAGFVDYGVEIERDIQSAIGRAPQVSGDGRWSFFDLTGLAPQFGTPEDLASLGQQLLNGPRISLEGCSSWTGYGEDRFSWCGASGAVHIDNADAGGPVVLDANVIAPGGAGTLTFDAGGVRTDIPIGPGPTPISLRVPAGEEPAISFKADVQPVIAPGDPRDLRFQLIDPHVEPAG